MSGAGAIFCVGDSYVINVEDEATGNSYRILLTSLPADEEPFNTACGLHAQFSHEYFPGDGMYMVAFNVHLCGRLNGNHRRCIGLELDNGGVPLAARNDALRLLFEMYFDNGSIHEAVGITAELRVEMYHVVDDETNRVLETSTEDLLRPTPASREAVDALEKVVIGSNAHIREVSCRVCLDEFTFGYEATKMPCSHVFHGDCIGKWLETRFVCPLCHFELPRDEETTPEDI